MILSQKKTALQAQKQEQVTSPVTKTAERRENYLQEQQRRNEKRKRTRLLAETETQITQLEQQIQEKEHLLAQPDIYTNYEEATRVQNELDQLNVQLEKMLEHWSELAEGETD